MSEPMFFVDGLVQVDSISTAEQARACVYFLEGELRRHLDDRQNALVAADYHRALARFYQSAVDRHEPDIAATEAKIARILALWPDDAATFDIEDVEIQ